MAVASINQAIDMNDETKLSEALENPDAKLQDVDERLGTRYLSHFVAVKKEKREVCLLSWVGKYANLDNILNSLKCFNQLPRIVNSMYLYDLFVMPI